MPKRIIILLILMLSLAACEQAPLLERIKQSGLLRVATTNSATTFYEGAETLEGFEYELATEFAKSLDVPVEFVLYQSDEALIKSVQTGQVHMAAAGLTVTDEHANYLLSSTPYQEIEQLLLYRRGERRPGDLNDLAEPVTIPARSSYEHKLSALKSEHPGLKWHIKTGANIDDILTLLNNGNIKYAVADSNQAALSQSYYAHIKPAFTLPGKEQLAWGFPLAYDNSLVNAANQFLEMTTQSGRIKKLHEKYYGDISSMAFVDDRDFWRNVAKRLPKYENLFKKAATATDLDWRLLAAIGYQESHWDRQAVSPTGVRGIMMLTKGAASQLEVKDRSDPEESILGGAQYIIWKMERIPERIQGKDRLWLGLAAYNIGYGHLEDARVLTQRQGGDPDKWEEVKKRLPLLSKEKYYSKLKHGYARGGEPVAYVENIQHYYRLLIWHSNQEKGTEGIK